MLSLNKLTKGSASACVKSRMGWEHRQLRVRTWSAVLLSSLPKYPSNAVFTDANENDRLMSKIFVIELKAP